MTTEVASLSFKKKITAVFADGSRKQNLGVSSVLELLSGVDKIAIDIDPEIDTASALYNEVEIASGLKTLTVGNDLFLVRSIQEDVAAAEAPIEVLEVAELPATPAETPVEPTVALTAEEGQFDIPTQLTRGGLIILGPKEVYTNCEQALAAFLKMCGSEPLPAKFHHDLTKTFMNGKAEGQIQSLFKDVKKFGPAQMAAKLNEFRVHAFASNDTVYSKYRAWIKHGVQPHHTFTFINGRTDSNFFKFWALMEIHKVNMKTSG